MSRWHSCNILQTAAGGRHLWQLAASGDGFTVQNDKSLLLDEPAPASVVSKDWQTLIRSKLNIAWLPADKVFLRALQVPPADPAETAQMVELQLEKLSPLPVTHIVWSVHLLPRQAAKPDALQTVIVIIASRASVEEFLGQLETDGFMADRLEAPGLDQLLAAKFDHEGVWIFPDATGEPALVAWYYGGTMQNVSLIALPPGPERGALLRKQIEQIAWAGELEGWLTGAPRVVIVAVATEATFWESVFKEAGETIELAAPLTPPQLAAFSARRCAAESATTNLLPKDFVVKYKQRFTDRVWFSALMAVGSAYVLGLLIYFGALYALQARYTKVDQELRGLSGSYTNALKDVEQIKILKERQQLKFGALDCWSTVAKLLPDSMTINSLYFDRSKVELSGTVTADDVGDINTFNEALRNAQNPQKAGELLFTEVSPPSSSIHGSQADWRFTCTLAAQNKNE